MGHGTWDMGHNRIIHLESFIKEGREYFEQTLLQKGWTQSGFKVPLD